MPRAGAGDHRGHPIAVVAVGRGDQAAVAARFAELEHTLSAFGAESDLARLNAAAGSNDVAIGPDTAKVEIAFFFPAMNVYCGR